ncbi:hypothetical protein [Persicobacter diffluens]|uniref:Uncharacterized protein n=1 Tax=Persicobacter diffluens TaxID=981 RepID=A0AAN4W1T5_9BACT|nr:hypothetical protein PEDI_38560 [Persicobacter diffluens]
MRLFFLFLFVSLCLEGQTQVLKPINYSISNNSSQTISDEILEIVNETDFEAIPNPSAYTYTLTSVPGVWVKDGADSSYVPKGALYLLHNGSWGTALAKYTSWTQEDINQG